MDEVYIGVKNWWSYLLRGLLAIAFGILLLVWPASTIRVLAILAGILFLVDGVVETIWSFVLLSRKEKMAMMLARGVIGLLIGILLLVKTGFALAFIVVLIAIWAIISGAIELILAIEMPAGSGRGWVGAGGALSIILGILLLALPLETVYAIIIVLSIFLLLSGIISLVLAYYAHKAEKEIAKA